MIMIYDEGLILYKIILNYKKYFVIGYSYLGNNNDILLGHLFKCKLCMNTICVYVIKSLNFNILEHKNKCLVLVKIKILFKDIFIDNSNSLFL